MSVFGKFDGKAFLTSVAVILVLFQIVSILLGKFFETFSVIASQYQTVWAFVILALLTFLVSKLVLNVKEFNRTSIFVMLVAIALVFAIAIMFFGNQFPGIFNGSIIQAELASIIP